MKIFIIDDFKFLNTSYKFDGSSIHVWELVTNLSKLGNQVHILCDTKYSSLSGIYLHTKPQYKIFHRLFKIIFFIKIIRKNNFDVIYTRSFSSYRGIAAYIAKKIIGIPIIFEVNSIRFEESKLFENESSQENFINNMKINYRKKKEIFMWKRADALVVVTGQMKQILANHGVDKKKIWVIENGANTELFKPMDQQSVKKELGLKPECQYVCFQGNLMPWQGVEYLIKSASLVKEKINLKYIIVGDGMLRETLEKAVNDANMKDYFIFTGHVPYENVPKYINTSDVCVAPFILGRNMKIGLSPLKIYEYMSCGKTVISSRIPNLEFIEEQEAGILIEPENPIELASAIVKVLNDNKFQKNGKNSREFIKKYHSWKYVAQKVAEVCDNVIKSNRK